MSSLIVDHLRTDRTFWAHLAAEIGVGANRPDGPAIRDVGVKTDVDRVGAPA
jgi:hypothetical protein